MDGGALIVQLKQWVILRVRLRKSEDRKLIFRLGSRRGREGGVWGGREEVRRRVWDGRGHLGLDDDLLWVSTRGGACCL